MATTTNSYLPFKTNIALAREIAKDVKLFSISVPKDFTCRPGQFVMVSVPGVGEAPISITAIPGPATNLELCVRSVGRVSSAINALKTGDAVWLRGPYGKPFPIHDDRDVLFICGGIGVVPLRPLINEMLERKGPSVTVMYGSRNPDEVLFLDEVDAWRSRGAEILLTVDTCSLDTWKGCKGVVTDHFGRVHVDFRSSAAYICGPHVMINAAMRDLSLMGMPDEHIITTLEAHMKCGVGKCGHCYCGGKLICEEGPVFTLAEIRRYNIQAGIDHIE